MGQRTVEREVSAAETEVAECEARLALVRTQLEDPDLYLTPDGGKRASVLGQELEQARRALDRAFERWEAATQVGGGG